MSRHKELALILVMALLVPAIVFGADFMEPVRPDTDRVFDLNREKQIEELALLSPEDFFQRMKADEFVTNPDLMYRTIYRAFDGRRADIVELAGRHLMIPSAKYDREGFRSRGRDFDVARRILEVFPEGAVPVLGELYEYGDPATRGNAVRAAGNVAGGQVIRRLLLKALDDRSAYEGVDPQDLGEPMRVCDAAYNQLVLRYKIHNVQRTIGPAFTIEVRDQLIELLREKFRSKGGKR